MSNAIMVKESIKKCTRYNNTRIHTYFNEDKGFLSCEKIYILNVKHNRQINNS